MDINEIIRLLNFSTIVSEQEVRTKIAVPILEALGYSPVVRAEEFPVYGFSGGTPLRAKSADILLFDDHNHGDHRSHDQRHWVMSHSLLCVELKKPGEDIENSLGQAQFYAMWTRCLFYMCTNGQVLQIYKLSEYCADELVFDCLISNLSNYWPLIQNTLSFNSLCDLKSKIGEVKTQSKPIYEQYCISLLAEKIDKWNWVQKASGKEYYDENGVLKQDVIETPSILNLTNNIVLLAPSGFGKTTTFLRFREELARTYLSGDTTQVPIFIYAKHWRRAYQSLHEAILKELQPFLPGITLDYINIELLKNRYILLIDGLDECLNDKDILIDSIKKLSVFSSTCVRVTCRNDRYNSELNDFMHLNLLELSNEEIIKIIKPMFGECVPSIVYSMNGHLNQMIRNPYYFSMWIDYCMEKRELKLPDNYTDLLEKFILRSISEYPIRKGNYTKEIIPIKEINKVLNEFAYSGLYGDEEDIFEIIAKHPYLHQKSDQVWELLYQSGLIVAFDEFVDFRQYSLKEYCCARYIANLPTELIIKFFMTQVHVDRSSEIIFHILGGIPDYNKQNQLLDWLENNALSLYIRCLKRRYNFSNAYKQLSNEQCRTFFNQILTSYENMVNSHFSSIKDKFYPWVKIKGLDNPQNYTIHLDGSINTNSLLVDIKLGYTENDKEALSIQYDASEATMTVNPGTEKAQMIPVMSFSNDWNLYYFNINMLYEGIDCSREIATNLLKSNIKRMIDKQQLLFEETPYMQLCYIETALSKLPLRCKDKDTEKTRQLSIKQWTNEQLLNFFYQLPNPEAVSNITGEYNAVVVMALLTQLKDLTLDINRAILPDWDENPETSHYVYELPLGMDAYNTHRAYVDKDYHKRGIVRKLV